MLLSSSKFQSVTVHCFVHFTKIMQLFKAINKALYKVCMISMFFLYIDIIYKLSYISHYTTFFYLTYCSPFIEQSTTTLKHLCFQYKTYIHVKEATDMIHSLSTGKKTQTQAV